jgi:hypothetical protein
LIFKQEDADFAVSYTGLAADGIAKQTIVWQAKRGWITQRAVQSELKRSKEERASSAWR